MAQLPQLVLNCAHALLALCPYSLLLPQFRYLALQTGDALLHRRDLVLVLTPQLLLCSDAIAPAPREAAVARGACATHTHLLEVVLPTTSHLLILITDRLQPCSERRESSWAAALLRLVFTILTAILVGA